MTIFNEDEIDTLKEIINVSYSMATALITNAVGSHAILSVPEVIITPISEIQEQLAAIPVDFKHSVITNQKFKGAFSGESMLLIDKDSALHLASLMLGEPEESLDVDDVDSCTLELSNVLTSVSIGRLSELLGAYMAFSAPKLLDKGLDEIVVTYQNDDFEQFFIIKTWLTSSDKSITGYLVIFINEESFEYLKKTICAYIEENV